MEGYALWGIVLVGLVWHYAMRARERAMEVVRRSCGEMELQWLDETVTITSMGFRRDDEGRLRLRRIYGFRYLEAGYLIREGVVIFLGDELNALLLNTSWRRH